MSVKDLRAFVRRFFEEWNKGKGIAAIDKGVATNYIFHRGTGEDLHGVKDFKQYMSGLYSSFPDNQMTLDDVIVEGGKAVVRFTFTGTHRGEFMGIRPTNKKVMDWMIGIDKVVDGKFVESWARSDTLGFMQQLGVVPTTKKES